MGKTPNSNTSIQSKGSSNFEQSDSPSFMMKVARFLTCSSIKESSNFEQTISFSENRSPSRFRKYSTSSYNSESGNNIVSESFSIEEIYKATHKFSPANILGEGAFGTVYKGTLKNGSIVAVKRAKKKEYDQKRLSMTEFKNEILTLSHIEHQNLVRLFGFLEHGDEQIILIEYVANGTLREHLNGTRGNGLEAADRLDIAIDIAHAITYLHTYTDPPIIHRDIKSSNILITEKLRAKVSDFGFAKLGEEGSSATHISTQVKGTTGYLDPEYLKTYQLTEKSDVYSFGVLLVELVTGRYPLQPNRPVKEHATVKWAMHKLKDGDAVLAMDPMIRRTPGSIVVVEKVLKLARQCLAPSRQSRPPMKRCAEVLWAIRKHYNDKALPSKITAPSRYSENFLEKNAKKKLDKSFGIEEDSDNYRFKSA